MSEEEQRKGKCIVSSVSMYEDDYKLLNLIVERMSAARPDTDKFISKSVVFRYAIRSLAEDLGVL